MAFDERRDQAGRGARVFAARDYEPRDPLHSPRLQAVSFKGQGIHRTLLSR